MQAWKGNDIAGQRSIGARGLIQFGSSPFMALFALVKVGLGLGMISHGVIVPMRWWVQGLLVVGALVIGFRISNPLLP